MGWKEATRLALIGGKKIITIISSEKKEYWIRPKKLPVEISDEIGELGRSDLRDPENKERIPQYRSLIKKMEEEGKSIEEFSKFDESDKLEIAMVSPITDKELRNKIYRLYLLHGIGEHNLEDDEGKLIGEGKVLAEKTVDEILEWGPLAEEIIAVIQEYNRPLPKGSGSTSETSPNGFSNPKNSQTARSSLPPTGDVRVN